MNDLLDVIFATAYTFALVRNPTEERVWLSMPCHDHNGYNPPTCEDLGLEPPITGISRRLRNLVRAARG